MANISSGNTKISISDSVIAELYFSRSFGFIFCCPRANSSVFLLTKRMSLRGLFCRPWQSPRQDNRIDRKIKFQSPVRKVKIDEIKIKKRRKKDKKSRK
jgi:hypothetical protein